MHDDLVAVSKVLTVWFDDIHLTACVDQKMFNSHFVSNKEPTLGQVLPRTVTKSTARPWRFSKVAGSGKVVHHSG